MPETAKSKPRKTPRPTEKLSGETSTAAPDAARAPSKRPESIPVARVEFIPSFSATGKVPIHTGGITDHRVQRQGRPSKLEIAYLPAIQHIRVTSTDKERPGSLMVPIAGNVRHWEPLEE